MKNKFYEDQGGEKADKKKMFRNRMIHSRAYRILFISVPLFILFSYLRTIWPEEQFKTFLIGFFSFVCMFLIYYFRKSDKSNILITKQKKELAEQKKLLEEQKILVDKAYQELHEKNKEVMDSIRYAKRIQIALITSEKYIENSLNKLIKN